MLREMWSSGTDQQQMAWSGGGTYDYLVAELWLLTWMNGRGKAGGRLLLCEHIGRAASVGVLAQCQPPSW